MSPSLLADFQLGAGATIGGPCVSFSACKAGFISLPRLHQRWNHDLRSAAHSLPWFGFWPGSFLFGGTTVLSIATLEEKK